MIGGSEQLAAELRREGDLRIADNGEIRRATHGEGGLIWKCDGRVMTRGREIAHFYLQGCTESMAN